MAESDPEVTVVVPTRNSATTLLRCLESVKEQDVANEVVVVDNFSEDETPAIARRFPCTLIQEGPERSTQRNLGARQGRAPWLVFIDSDMVLQRDVLQSCLAVAREDPADAVIIPELAAGRGLLGRARSLEKRLYLNDKDIEAARFFSRRAFEDLGGFDPRLFAGEDWDLTARARAAGLTVSRATGTILHLEGRLTLWSAFRKKFYYGRSLSEYRKLQPSTSRKQLSPLRPALLRNWRLVLRTPLVCLALVALKGCEFLGVLGGRLSAAASKVASLRRGVGRQV